MREVGEKFVEWRTRICAIRRPHKSGNLFQKILFVIASRVINHKLKKLRPIAEKLVERYHFFVGG